MAHIKTCPRCGTGQYVEYGDPGMEAAVKAGIMPPALSRTDNETYICSPCGTDEALLDWVGRMAPASEWPVPRVTVALHKTEDKS